MCIGYRNLIELYESLYSSSNCVCLHTYICLCVFTSVWSPYRFSAYKVMIATFKWIQLLWNVPFLYKLLAVAVYIWGFLFPVFIITAFNLCSWKQRVPKTVQLMKQNIFLRKCISFQGCGIPYFGESHASSQIIPLELHLLESKTAKSFYPTPLLAWSSFPHIILHNSVNSFSVLSWWCTSREVFLWWWLRRLFKT